MYVYDHRYERHQDILDIICHLNTTFAHCKYMRRRLSLNGLRYTQRIEMMIKMQQQGIYNKMSPFWIAVDDKSSNGDIFHKYINNLIFTLTRPLWKKHHISNMIICFSTCDYIINEIVWDAACVLHVRNEHVKIQWDYVRKAHQSEKSIIPHVLHEMTWK